MKIEYLGPIDLELDLERMNFLSWYMRATREDISLAWKNNAAKLKEMINKYQDDIVRLLEREYGHQQI